RLIDRAVGIVAADVTEDEDPAISRLDRAGIIRRAGHVEFVPRLPRVAGPMNPAGGDVKNGPFPARQQLRMAAVRERRRSDPSGTPVVPGFLDPPRPAPLAPISGRVPAPEAAQQILAGQFRRIELLTAPPGPMLFRDDRNGPLPRPALIVREEEQRLE